MLFNSLEFVLFLPLVFVVYWFIPTRHARYRCIFILIASYYFYMSWNAKYVFLIFLTTFVSYFSAIALEKASDNVSKQRIVALSAIVSIGVLFFFKYYNFFAVELCSLMAKLSINVSPYTLKILLPVGISFYTFQTLSYVIDAYRGKITAERDFIKYATFVSFFPQLVAGPIERSENLLPQLNCNQKFEYDLATDGIRQMTWGFFKKLVIADNLAVYVDKVYSNPHAFEGFSLVLAVLFFSIQIYCDFSGYSDIAIGTAKLFGIKLMNNFASPYFSTSLKEFWGRWHISLSSWFRDYLYIPLGGNKTSKIRYCCNIMVTFLISGLWHGANSTFVMWGGTHGVALIIERLLMPKYRFSNRVLKVISGLAVFSFCAMAWNIFRAKTMHDAFYIFSNMTNGLKNFSLYVSKGINAIGLTEQRTLELSIFIILLFGFDYYIRENNNFEVLKSQKFIIRHIVYIVLIFSILIFKPSESVTFVYFQF